MTENFDKMKKEYKSYQWQIENQLEGNDDDEESSSRIDNSNKNLFKVGEKTII